MIQVKGRYYFIKESELTKPYRWNDKYWVKDRYGNRFEIDLEDYLSLGGEL